MNDSWKSVLAAGTLIPVILTLQAAVIWVMATLSGQPAPSITPAETTLSQPAEPSPLPLPAPVREAAVAESPRPFTTNPVTPRDETASVDTVQLQSEPLEASEDSRQDGADQPAEQPDPAPAAVEPELADPEPPVVPEPAIDRSDTAMPGLREPVWLEERDPGHYTIQLHSGRSLEGVRDLAARLGLSEPHAYYRSLRNGKSWYALVMGDYEDQQAAWKAVAELRARAPGLEPWIRRIGDIQRSLK